MKRVFSYSLALCLSVVMLGSCKKDSASNNNNTNVAPGKSDVKFTYAGAASGSFASSSLTSTCMKSTALISVNGSAVSGTSADIATVILPLGTTTGEHLQSGTQDHADDIVVTFTKGSTGWAIGGGGATGFKINVTRSDATGIEGTFSGQLGNDSDGSKITITNGTFKGAY